MLSALLNKNTFPSLHPNRQIHLGQWDCSLLVVCETEEDVVTLPPPTKPLKTHSEWDLVPRYNPSTHQSDCQRLSNCTSEGGKTLLIICWVNA